MSYLEDLYSVLLEERVPDSPEYKENQHVRTGLMNKVEEALGREMVDKIETAYGELLWIENEYFLRCGLRFGLELLRL